MARNFSEDGAIGAMTGDTPGAGGSALQPSIMNGFTTQDKPSTPTASPVTTTPLTGAIPGVDSDAGDGEGMHTAIGGNDRTGFGGNDRTGFGGGFTPMGVRAPNKAPRTDDWRDQSNYPAPAWNFSQGGAIDEGGDPNATDPQGSMMGNRLQQSINQALSTVNSVLSYGRNLHGITGGGQKEAMNTEGFRPSGNVEDRRNGDMSPDPNSFGESMKRRVGNRVDEVKGMFSPDQTKNKMSQDAGINDIGSGGTAQPPAQAGAQQAIQAQDQDDDQQPAPSQAIDTEEEAA